MFIMFNSSDLILFSIFFDPFMASRPMVLAWIIHAVHLLSTIKKNLGIVLSLLLTSSLTRCTVACKVSKFHLIFDFPSQGIAKFTVRPTACWCFTTFHLWIPRLFSANCFLRLDDIIALAWTSSWNEKQTVSYMWNSLSTDLSLLWKDPWWHLNQNL